MQQRMRQKTADSAGHSDVFLSLFSTDIGWMGIVGSNNIVRSVLIGDRSAAAVRKRAGQALGDEIPDGVLYEQDWYPHLRASLQDYSEGKPVDFAEFQLLLPPRTPFRDKVLAATRRLAYGETTTYGDLARCVGHPGAARAVGTVMSTNRFPIVIPCHRVLAAGGMLGGYTAPSGTDLKQRLLNMERAGSGSALEAECRTFCFG